MLRWYIPILLINVVTSLGCAQNAWAGLTVFDMKGVSDLWGDWVSPFDGWNARHELRQMRIFSENFGPKKFPFPCQHQIETAGQTGFDCPQNWPTVYLQFLFPRPFVPNQGSRDDALSSLTAEKIGALVEIIHDIDRNRLKTDFDYFKLTRSKIVELIYLRTENGKTKAEPKLDRHYMQGFLGTPLSYTGSDRSRSWTIPASQLFYSITSQNYSNSDVFFEAFAYHELQLREAIPMAGWAFLQDSQIDKKLKTGIQNNWGWFIGRSVAENFANALLGTLIISLEKPYYENFPEKVLYAYFSIRFELREDILLLLKSIPSLARANADFLSNPDSQDAWIQDRFIKSDHDDFQNKLSQITPPGSSAIKKFYPLEKFYKYLAIYQRGRDTFLGFINSKFKPDLAQENFEEYEAAFNVLNAYQDLLAVNGGLRPDTLAFLSETTRYYSNKIPLVPPYGKASVRINKKSITEHSDCGENTLRFWFSLAFYNAENHQYDVNLWQERIAEYKLQPKSSVLAFFAGPTGEGRNPDRDLFREAHDAWSDQVMARLNEDNSDPLGRQVEYAKPPTAPVCEIKPGLDNVLFIFERLLGDTVDQEPVNRPALRSQGAPHASTLSLKTLSDLEQELLKKSPEDTVKIRGQFRKYKMNRIFKILSPLEGHKLRWSAGGEENVLPKKLQTLDIHIPSLGDFQWKIDRNRSEVYRNGQVVSVSACPEEVLRFWFGLAFGDPKTGSYNNNRWISQKNDHGLDPKIPMEIQINSPTQPLPLPQHRSIDNGFDTLLLRAQDLLGDIHDPSKWGNRYALPLITLSALEQETIEKDPDHIDEIKDLFRKFKLNRFFSVLFSKKHQAKMTWYAQTSDNELQNNYERITVSAHGSQFDFEVFEDHFDLQMKMGQPERWQYRISRIITEHLLKNRHHPSISNLHRFVVSGALAKDSLWTSAFQEMPELIYSFPLENPDEYINVVIWALENRIQSLYPKITPWLRNLPITDGKYVFPRLGLGAAFENILSEIEEGRLEPNSLEYELVRDVIHTIHAPFSLVFSNGNNAVFNHRVFQQILNQGRLTKESFFYEWSFGIQGAHAVAERGILALFEEVQNLQLGELPWLKTLFYVIRNTKGEKEDYDREAGRYRRDEFVPNPMYGHHRELIRRIINLNGITSEDLLAAKETGRDWHWSLLHAVASLLKGPLREQVFLDLLASGKFSREHFLVQAWDGKTVCQYLTGTADQKFLNHLVEQGYCIETDFILVTESKSQENGTE